MTEDSTPCNHSYDWRHRGCRCGLISDYKDNLGQCLPNVRNFPSIRIKGRFLARRQPDGTVYLVGVCEPLHDINVGDESLIEIDVSGPINGWWTDKNEAPGDSFERAALNGALSPSAWSSSVV